MEVFQKLKRWMQGPVGSGILLISPPALFALLLVVPLLAILVFSF